MKQEVEDRPTEKGILYNNILTFLILAVMSWVGVNIMDINKSIAVFATTITVNTSEIDHNRIDISRLRDDFDTHIRRDHE